MKKLIKTIPYLLVATLVGVTVAYAGSLTPPGPVLNTMYTLDDIYTKLTTNADATLGSGTIPATPGSISTTFHTLTELYSAIPTIDATKVLSGTTYLGVAGSASAGADLSDMFNGTCLYTESGHDNCPLGTEFPGGSQANGGVDDFNGYNLGGARPVGSFSTTWTTCNVGNSYCGTGDAGANAKDTATGLIWSYPCHGSGCATWDTSDSATLTAGCIPGGNCAYYDTDTYYSWTSAGSDNNSRTAKQLCSDHTGWSLPHQKQLMQAYIDGSYVNLEPEGVYRHYWSATTVSFNPTYAWNVYLSDGFTNGYTKSIPYLLVRCLRE